MLPTRPAYPDEFKVEAIRLYRSSSQSLKSVASDLGVSTNSLRVWVRRAETEATSSEVLTTDERVELARLRRENRVLKEEREILRKATAFFAKETDR